MAESLEEAAAKSKKLVLRSSDGETFEVEEDVALQSETIKHIPEDGCAQNGIPLPNVTSNILAKVIEYCRKHVDEINKDKMDKFRLTYPVDEKDDALSKWDAEFVKLDQNILFDLILAANYLHINSLFELTCKTVADMMRGKSPDQIRKIFHIKNDYTPEEEAEARKENEWAFD